MHQKLCEFCKKFIKLVGRDIREFSRTGPQNTWSHAMVSTLDLTHLNIQSEMNSGGGSVQWLCQLKQQISHASYTMTAQFFMMLSCSFLFLTELLSSSIVFLSVLSEPAP